MGSDPPTLTYQEERQKQEELAAKKREEEHELMGRCALYEENQRSANQSHPES